MRRPLALPLVGLAILAVIAGGLSIKMIREGRNGTAVESAEAGPQPAVEIGGPFELVDHNGRKVTDRDFRGSYLLVFFGYTFCPDVCPTALAKVAAVLDELGPLGDRIQPLFISVDPERDTPEVLAEFVHQFHPRIIGLTGSPNRIAEVARAYRAYYRKVTQEELTGEKGSGDDYLMDHSAYLYLMDPEGRFVRVFSHTDPPERIVEALRKVLGAAAAS